MSYKVLILEDKPALNDVLCSVLRKTGYELHGFFDAESVIGYHDLKSVDVLLLDTQSPGDSGWGLIRRIRSLTPSVGLLMLTTKTANLDRIDGYNTGVNCDLPMPISEQELIDTVRSLMSRKKNAVHSNNQVAHAYSLSGVTNTVSCGSRSIRAPAGDAAIFLAMTRKTVRANLGKFRRFYGLTRKQRLVPLLMCAFIA